MAPTLAIVLQDALALPQDDRLALACRLLESVEPDADPDAESAWEEEIARRIASFKSGECKPVPVAEVLASLREIVP